MLRSLSRANDRTALGGGQVDRAVREGRFRNWLGLRRLFARSRPAARQGSSAVLQQVETRKRLGSVE
jgi:hypothetical protein